MLIRNFVVDHDLHTLTGSKMNAHARVYLYMCMCWYIVKSTNSTSRPSNKSSKTTKVKLVR